MTLYGLQYNRNVTRQYIEQQMLEPVGEFVVAARYNGSIIFEQDAKPFDTASKARQKIVALARKNPDYEFVILQVVETRKAVMEPIVQPVDWKV